MPSASGLPERKRARSSSATSSSSVGAGRNPARSSSAAPSTSSAAGMMSSGLTPPPEAACEAVELPPEFTALRVVPGAPELDPGRFLTNGNALLPPRAGATAGVGSKRTQP